MDTPYEKLLAKLVRADVKFIIVGGVAVALNGFMRTTEDVDILVEASVENVTRFLHELGNFGEGHARQLSPADFSDSEGEIRIIEDFPLDVFTIMRGKRYADLFGATKTTRIDDVNVRYLNAEALIALKSNSQRDQDRIDVSTLQSLKDRNEPVAGCSVSLPSLYRRPRGGFSTATRAVSSALRTAKRLQVYFFCPSRSIGTKRTGSVALSFN